MLAAMAYDGLTQQETKMILDSLYSTKERVHNEGTDTLKFLLALLAKRLTARYMYLPSPPLHLHLPIVFINSRAHDITFHLYALGGLLPFLAMLSRQDEKLRIWALKVIAKLLEQATPKAKQCLLTFSSSNLAMLAAAAIAGTKPASPLPTPAAQHDSSGTPMQDNKLSSVIKHELQNLPFGRESYYALLEILLEHVTIQNINTDPLKSIAAKAAAQQQQQYPPPSKPRPMGLARSFNSSEKINSSDVTAPPAPQAFVFKNASILSTIFEVLCLSRDPMLQQKALEDFYFLLSSEVQNRELFLAQEHWQTWLLGMLAQNLPSEEQSEAAANIFSSLIKIFTLLFHHCFYKVPPLPSTFIPPFCTKILCFLETRL